MGTRRKAVNETETFCGSVSKGFSLVEALVTTLLVVVAAVAALQYLSHAHRHYRAAESHWQETVELWNRSQRLRAFADESAEDRETLEPAEGGPHLWRWRLPSPDAARDRRWEVLHGPR